MPQENGHHSNRHSNRSTPLRTNYQQTDNGIEKTRSNHDIKERGYYSELATMNPEAAFEVKKNDSRKKSIRRISGQSTSTRGS